VGEKQSVVELADRPVDPRRASIGYALVLVAFAASVNPVANQVYETLDLPPLAVTGLEEHADPTPLPPSGPLEPLVVLLLDGMRVDESERSAPIEALRSRGMSGIVELTEMPTLSRPYYHALLTGVPQRGSGVRRNRPGQRQVFDSLPDRVRAAGGEVAFIAEDLDWMSVLFARDGDVDHSGPDALEGPLSDVLNRLTTGSGTAFTLIHVLAIDESAHDYGIDCEEHRRALSLGDRVVSDVAEAAFGRALLAVMSDHGHIAVGGHGGDEPDVRFAPFILVGDGVPHGRLDRHLAVEELAPTLASWMGTPPPRMAVTDAAPELAGPAALERPLVTRRATLLTAATNADRAAQLRRWGWLVPLTALLILMGLGATKRSFSGLDLGTLIAPAFVATALAVIHLYVLNRPFTMSALDDPTRQGYRLAAIAGVLALVSIPSAAAIARRRAHDTWPMHLRRAAGGVGWASLSFAAVAVVGVGGTLGPWPPTAFGVYAPILAFASGGGAAAAAGIVLIISAFSRTTTIVGPAPVDQSEAL